MVLKPNGLTLRTGRTADEQKSEILASRDNWFRPVQARTGPDGALWVVDMYRFVIEHPRWIPPDRLEKLDVRAGDDKGRIYRVYPKGKKLRPVLDLTKLSPAKLAAMLDTPNGTERDRIHQELVFGGDRKQESGGRKQESGGRSHHRLRPATERGGQVIETLSQLAVSSKLPAVRLQALCVLDGLGALNPGPVERAMVDAHPAVRANAIRLSESFMRSMTSSLAQALFRVVNDPELT